METNGRTLIFLVCCWLTAILPSCLKAILRAALRVVVLVVLGGGGGMEFVFACVIFTVCEEEVGKSCVKEAHSVGRDSTESKKIRNNTRERKNVDKQREKRVSG